jgi:hypothetical protein
VDVREARRAAHNIQEPTFCALRTARVNAMLARWWRAPIVDLPGVIERFVTDPLAPEFAPIHAVGEDYAERVVGPNMMPIPDVMRSAATLRQIADSVYQLPVSALQPLQPEIDPDDVPPDRQVLIPEPAFAPILAARLSAEALVSPALSQPERCVCVRRLVPVAAEHPTVMHTVLTRLLLVTLPEESGVLDAVAELAPWDWMQEPSARDATEFGPA